MMVEYMYVNIQIVKSRFSGRCEQSSEKERKRSWKKLFFVFFSRVCDTPFDRMRVCRMTRNPSKRRQNHGRGGRQWW